MLLTVILLLLFLFVIALLFVPIQLYVNTDTSEYYVRVIGLARVSVEPDKEELFRIRLKTLIFQHSFYPLRRKSEIRKSNTEHKAKRSRKVQVRKIVRLLRSFEVRKFVLDIDTGDYMFNAKMYPVFVLLNNYVASFHVNFQDRNLLVIDIRNRPYKIIKSFINY